ncbi:putative HAT dimerization domain, ribonuclease H-like superfamily [Helianthus annuus]|nr:putative HAT dimerization domain, ribonuclease H-like superfamily [Helianthus annuus]
MPAIRTSATTTAAYHRNQPSTTADRTRLVLVLPVATATIERCFSTMKNVKTDLRNRIDDENLSDSCICYIEKKLLKKVGLDDVLDRFQKMKTRRATF